MAKLPFDKLRWRMNIADIAQEFLALLMMISRFRFARFDVLKTAELPTYLSSLVATAIAYLIPHKAQHTPPTSLTPRITGDFISSFHAAPGAATA